MGWETRSGRRVYYEKVRKGGRVVSRYWGHGLLAEVQAERAEEAHARRASVKEMMADETAHDALLQELERDAALCARVALLAAGCHTHHRAWRTRR